MSLMDILPSLTGNLKMLAPYADQAGAALGVSPATVLGQWALESGNGNAANAVGATNFAGIMQPGTQTLQTFQDPQSFEQAYVNLIENGYPDALNTGSDVGAFVNALTANPNHMYTTTPASDYLSRLKARMQSIGLPSSGTDTGSTSGMATAAPSTGGGSAVSTAQSTQSALAGIGHIFTWIYDNPLSALVLFIVSLAAVGIVISTVWNSGKAVAAHV
jgi:hypothetical protein